MKLLLVNCINWEDGDTPFENVSEHLGLPYIASSLRQRFSSGELEIKITYGPLTNSMLNEFKPDVVGLSSVSQNYNLTKRYAKVCKEHGIAVVTGGVHISVLPQTLSKDMDVGVINEGELTMTELMGVFKEEGSFLKARLSDIKGIVYRDGGEIVRTPLCEPIQDLDTLPMPARDLFPHFKKGMTTARGCPYDCIFCFSKPFWGKKARFFSPEYVLREITVLVEKFKTTHIPIYDDLFVANRTRFKKIVQLIRDAGLHKKVEFSCNIIAREVTEETAELLRSINVVNCIMGIESGNQRVLNYLKKQACTIEQNYNAVRVLKKYGILTSGAFIIGSPDETEEEMMDTYRFIRKSSKIDICNTAILTPFPGTPIWDLAKKKGLVNEENMDWSILKAEIWEVPNRHPTLCETMSKECLIRIYKKFRRLRKIKLFYAGFKHPAIGFRYIKTLAEKRLCYLKLVFSNYLNKNFGIKWKDSVPAE